MGRVDRAVPSAGDILGVGDGGGNDALTTSRPSALVNRTHLFYLCNKLLNT